MEMKPSCVTFSLRTAQSYLTMKTNSKTFEQDVVKSEIPVLVDFFATWCGPCKMLAPALDSLAERYQGRAKIMKVDVDESPELAGQFGIQAVPTLILFNHGKVVQQSSGVPSMHNLSTMLDAVVLSPASGR
jgi:thioredoxin 1